MKDTFNEVLQAVLPLTVAVLMIMILIGLDSDIFISFLKGAILVIIGMALFLYGVKVGMLPIGEAIGAQLPKQNSLIFMAGVAFILSFMVTVAEPDVQVLCTTIDSIATDKISNTALVVAIAAGVGFFVALSLIRIVLGIPIQYILTLGYLCVIILSFYTKPQFLALACDAGGIATGPLIVPVIMALGLGTVSVLGTKSELADGFGIVGLASLGPIISVMLLGVM